MAEHTKGQQAPPTAMIITDDGWIGFHMPPGYVYVALAKIEGVWEIVGLRVDVASGDFNAPLSQDLRSHLVERMPAKRRRAAVVTADRLRGLPLRALRAAAASYLAGESENWIHAYEAVERQQGKALSDQHYAQVADVYRDAVERSEPPLKAVMARWHVSRAGASKYVARARELKLLGYPSRPGIAGAEAKRSPIKRDRAGETS